MGSDEIKIYHKNQKKKSEDEKKKKRNFVQSTKHVINITLVILTSNY